MPAFAANVEFLFTDSPKPDRIARAAAAGFRGIELGYVSPDQLAAVRAAAHRHSIEIVLLGVGLGDLEFGGCGYMGVPGQRAVVEREVRQALQIAQALGCRRLALPPSRVPETTDRKTCLKTLADHIAVAAHLAAPEGVEVLLEPLNSVDWPDFLLASTEDALSAVTAADRSNVGLQLDLYHAAMQGESVLHSVGRAGLRLRHVQFADVPGRHEPGTGTLPLLEVFSLLDDMGYRGWAGAEYIPTKSTENTLSWLRPVTSVPVLPRH